MIGPIMLAGLLSSHGDGPAIRSYREATNPARADPGSNSQADASIVAAPDASPLASTFSQAGDGGVHVFAKSPSLHPFQLWQAVAAPGVGYRRSGSQFGHPRVAVCLKHRHSVYALAVLE